MASSVSKSEAPPGTLASGEPIHRRGLDPATVIGLLGAVLLIGSASLMGGSSAAFYNLPSIMIVLGGTFAVTTMCFSLGEIFSAQRMMLRALVRSGREPSDAALHMLELAAQARRHGVLSLQEAMAGSDTDRFLKHALTLVADGNTADAIERMLGSEIGATAHRHAKSTGVLRKAAEIAPTMGLIGTLVGLVQMLGRLDDPSSIGPAMAVALLTTFYGAVLAHVFLAPLAAKLERNSREEILVKNIYAMSAASIARQENPRRLEMLLNAVLPPSKRVQFFD
ncbi:MAG: MotA/TolQ/ExbB proton channel family protein [Alphaproteobacteria bacterium]